MHRLKRDDKKDMYEKRPFAVYQEEHETLRNMCKLSVHRLRRRLRWSHARLIALVALTLYIWNYVSKNLHLPVMSGVDYILSGHTARLAPQTLTNISYDHRAFVINGQRQLLLVGSIHYPRSSPEMWPELFTKTKAAGINTIDTYVFWNYHEPVKGQYDFETGAEWNFGGLPVWLLQEPGLKIRTWNEPFMIEMERFVRKVVQVAKPFMGNHGGPIIAMQIENEYGNVQLEYGSDGHRYVLWAADLANRLDTGVPWFMCQNDDMLTVLTACNGFYCDNWIQHHWRDHYQTPPMFTELWTGWFQHWRTAKPVRPTEDLAFSSARWIARGGSFVGYYMWHGGTNFGRSSGDFKTTSYDYDAPLNEYGFPNEPKYSHLGKLHRIVSDFADVILASEPKEVKIGDSQEAYIYGDRKNGRAIAFLTNTHQAKEAVVDFEGLSFLIPKWTIFIVVRQGDEKSWRLVYSTSKTITPQLHPRSMPQTSDLRVHIDSRIEWLAEPKGIRDTSTSLRTNIPLEQVRLTGDSSDYLWYIYEGLNISKIGDDDLILAIQPPTDVVYVYFDDELMHSRESVVMNVNMDQLGLSKSEEKSIVRLSRDKLLRLKREKSLVNLNILSVTMGLVNYGAHYDEVRKGIHDSVALAGKDITHGPWYHQIGLLGEEENYHNSYLNEQSWTLMEEPGHVSTPLTWYKLKFTTYQVQSLFRKAPRLSIIRDYYSFALYLGTMGKGQAWVNGHAIGRFWDAASDSNACNQTACDWSGFFNSEKFLTDCGSLSQSYYHVPKDWLLPRGRVDPVEVVLFEERGGDPSGVQLVLIQP